MSIEQLNGPTNLNSPFSVYFPLYFSLGLFASLSNSIFPLFDWNGNEIELRVNEAISKGVDKNKSLMVLEAILFFLI